MKRTTRLLSLALTPLAALGALTITPTPAHAAVTKFTGYGYGYDKADWDKYLDWTGGTINETYRYIGLEPGHTYRLDTWVPDPDGRLPMIKAQTEFVAATTGEGYVKVEVPVTSLWHGKTLHIHHAVYEGARALDDGGDFPNYIYVLEMAQAEGVAVDAADGDRILPPSGGTVYETLTYANLIPNRTYRLQIMVGADDDSVATRHIWTQFTTDATGRGSVRYPVWLGPQYAGAVVSFYDSIYEGEKYVGGTAGWKDHIFVQAPVSGNAVDKLDGDKQISEYGGVVKETFTYSDLMPGRQYRLDVKLREQYGSLPPIKHQQYFVAGPSGSGTVVVELDVLSTYSGHTFQVIDTLYDREFSLGNYSDNWITVA